MAQLASAWKAPRPQPEILPATVGQAAEYMAWFVNRRAYTRQTDRPDEHSGKYYFYQARDRRTKERLSLDPLVIQKHLAGELTVGLYAINPETQCSKWVAIDADYEGAYRDLRTLKWELEQDGVHAVVEMSRRGAHLWILCERPLPARLCRIYIYSLALRLDVPIKGTFRQVDGIEVFPRQDEIGASEYGNAIRGPLGIHRANMHRYWFEDAPSNLADQTRVPAVREAAHCGGTRNIHARRVDSGVRLRPDSKGCCAARRFAHRISDSPARQGSIQTERQLLDAVSVLRTAGTRSRAG